MALESGMVATGDTILASDYNKLRNDLLSNHDHSTGQGGVVDHADLSETGDMSGMGHRHEDIDVHLLGSGPGPNSIDNPGGNKGVHGLASAAYAAGSLNSQLVIQAGTSTTNGYVDVGLGWKNMTRTITFPVPFSSIVGVHVTPIGASGTVSVDNVSVSGFRARVMTLQSETPTNFSWLAVGTK